MIFGFELLNSWRCTIRTDLTSSCRQRLTHGAVGLANSEVLTSFGKLHTHQMNKNISKLYDVASPFTKLVTYTIQQTFSDACVTSSDCNGSDAVIQWHLMQFWPDTRVFVREDLKGDASKKKCCN